MQIEQQYSSTTMFDSVNNLFSFSIRRTFSIKFYFRYNKKLEAWFTIQMPTIILISLDLKMVSYPAKVTVKKNPFFQYQTIAISQTVIIIQPK